MAAGQKIRVDGFVFHNERELQVYLGLVKMARDGRVTHLQVQPDYALIVRNRLIATFTPTFQFHDEDGKLRTIRIKRKTPSSSLTLKQALFEALFETTVEEWG